MIESERIELIYAVFDAAPSEWKTENSYASDNCRLRWDIPAPEGYFQSVDQVYLDLSERGLDRYNAEAILGMLDAMEKAGYVVRLSADFRVPKGSPLKYMAYYKRDADGITVLGTTTGGATRAEAVAKAFVAVFGKQPETGGK